MAWLCRLRLHTPCAAPLSAIRGAFFYILFQTMNFYLTAFVKFFKIGLFTIGGGYAMLPLIEAEVVEKQKWIEKEEFLDLVAIAQAAPGVFAVNISIFIGYKMKGIRGSLVTTLGAVLPSFLIILLIAIFFHAFKDNIYVERAFKAVRPAVVALIAVPVFSLAKSAKLNRYTIIIPIVAALLIWLLGVSPIWIILVAGIAGFVYGRVNHKKIENNGEKTQNTEDNK